MKGQFASDQDGQLALILGDDAARKISQAGDLFFAAGIHHFLKELQSVGKFKESFGSSVKSVFAFEFIDQFLDHLAHGNPSMRGFNGKANRTARKRTRPEMVSPTRETIGVRKEVPKTESLAGAHDHASNWVCQMRFTQLPLGKGESQGRVFWGFASHRTC